LQNLTSFEDYIRSAARDAHGPANRANALVAWVFYGDEPSWESAPGGVEDFDDILPAFESSLTPLWSAAAASLVRHGGAHSVEGLGSDLRRALGWSRSADPVSLGRLLSITGFCSVFDEESVCLQSCPCLECAWPKLDLASLLLRIGDEVPFVLAAMTLTSDHTMDCCDSTGEFKFTPAFVSWHAARMAGVSVNDGLLARARIVPPPSRVDRSHPPRPRRLLRGELRKALVALLCRRGEPARFRELLALVHSQCPDLSFVSSQQLWNCLSGNSDFVRVRPGWYFVSDRCRADESSAGLVAASVEPAAVAASSSKSPCLACDQAKEAAVALVSADARPVHIEDVAHSITNTVCKECGAEVELEMDGRMVQRLVQPSTRVVVDNGYAFRTEDWRLRRSKKLVDALEGALHRLGGKAKIEDVAAVVRDNSETFTDATLGQVRSCLYAQSAQRKRFLLLGGAVFCLPSAVLEGADSEIPRSRRSDEQNNGPREAVHAHQIVLRGD